MTARYMNMITPFILPSEVTNANGEKYGKHVSILIKGNKIVSNGYNNNNRTFFSGINTSSMHSEMHCVNKRLNPSERRLLKTQCNVRHMQRQPRKLCGFKSQSPK